MSNLKLIKSAEIFRENALYIRNNRRRYKFYLRRQKFSDKFPTCSHVKSLLLFAWQRASDKARMITRRRAAKNVNSLLWLFFPVFHALVGEKRENFHWFSYIIIWGNFSSAIFHAEIKSWGEKGQDFCRRIINQKYAFYYSFSRI